MYVFVYFIFILLHVSVTKYINEMIHKFFCFFLFFFVLVFVCFFVIIFRVPWYDLHNKSINIYMEHAECIHHCV